MYTVIVGTLGQPILLPSACGETLLKFYSSLASGYEEGPQRQAVPDKFRRQVSRAQWLRQTS